MGCARIVPKANLMFLTINGNDTIEFGAIGIIRIDFPKRNPNSIDVTHRHSPVRIASLALPSLPKHPNCPLLFPLPAIWIVYPVCEILETKEVCGKSLRLDKVDVTCLTFTMFDFTLLAHNQLSCKGILSTREYIL